MFVVIDGIDGSGKGTQLEAVTKRLEADGKKVLVLDFPRYEEDSSLFVRKYLNGEYGSHVDAKTASLFYALDRYDALHDFSSQFEGYDYILSNRYVSASMIHQGGKISDPEKRREYLTWLDELEFEICGIPRPDKVLFLDVCPQTSARLIESKEKRDYIESDENKDLHELDNDHLKNSYECAVGICELFSEWQRVECEPGGNLLTVEEITEKILSEIVGS